MLKSFAIILLAGAASVMAFDSARACGGGCGMSRSGGYGGRALASRKALAGGANLAQDAKPASPTSTAPGALATAKKPVTTPAKIVAIAKGKVAAKVVPKKLIYTCPMHPQIQWTSEVDCPICGMKLKPKAAKKPSQDETTIDSDEHAGVVGMDKGDYGMGDMSDTNGMHDTMICCPDCMGAKSDGD